MYEKHFFVCKCESLEHIVVFQYDADDGDFYMEVHLNPCIPWYKRIWHAARYVCGYASKYGNWDTVMLDSANVARLRAFLERVENERKLR